MNLKKNPASNWKLYCIIDSKVLKDKDPAKVAEFLFKKGVKAIQLRYKNYPSYKFVPIAKKIRKIASRYNASIIINDKVDVALSSKSAGIHLGEGDLTLDFARHFLGKRSIIGKTVHSLKEARKVKNKKIDYVGAGTVFKTPVKKHLKAKGTLFPEKIKECIEKPVFAIGGINSDNVKKVLQRNVDGVCVARAIFDVKKLFKEIKNDFN